jgi:DNA-binding PadR family transcriptional regulator
MNLNDQLRKGSTTVLLLALLTDKPMYGFQIIRELERRSQGYFTMKEGLLYPALHQMEASGLIVGEWRTEDNRQRKYYRITSKGRKEYVRATSQWRTFTSHLLRLIGETS